MHFQKFVTLVDLQFMLALLDRDPDLYLDEIQQQLEDQHGVIVSLATVWRTLRRLGITSKKVTMSLQYHTWIILPDFSL
jgi:transposase